MIPVVELERVYGKLRMPENGMGSNEHVQDETKSNGAHVEQNASENGWQVQRKQWAATEISNGEPRLTIGMNMGKLSLC